MDVQANRLVAAREAGALDAFPAGEEASERVREVTGGLGADLVIDTIGQRGSVRAAPKGRRTGYVCACPAL